MESFVLWIVVSISLHPEFSKNAPTPRHAPTLPIPSKAIDPSSTHVFPTAAKHGDEKATQTREAATAVAHEKPQIPFPSGDRKFSQGMNACVLLP
jgi:hypothetical protein